MPGPDLFQRYEEEFGHPPPLALLPAGEEAELIQEALDAGEPIQDRTPPGAVAEPPHSPTLVERARAGGLEAALRAQAVSILRVRRFETFERGGQLVRRRLPDPEPLKLGRDTRDVIGDLLRPSGQRRLWDHRRARAVGQEEPPPRTDPPRTGELARNRASRKALAAEALRVLDEGWPLEPDDREAIADLLRRTRDRVLWRQTRSVHNGVQAAATDDACWDVWWLVEREGRDVLSASQEVAPRHGMSVEHLRKVYAEGHHEGRMASWLNREAYADRGIEPIELVAQQAVDLIDNQGWSRWEAVKTATRHTGHDPARLYSMGEESLRELAAREVINHDEPWS